MTKIELKKLWVEAHIIHQERLKIKEWNQLIDNATKQVLFVIAATLAMFFILHIT